MEPDITLENQLCFALYAAARASQGAYRPVLAELDLTYPQWLVLLALWEEDGLSVGALGTRLRLDSGTLSPLLRRMESRGVITRRRAESDARTVTVHLSPEGRELRARAGDVQRCLVPLVDLSAEEAGTLRDLAHRLVASTERRTLTGRNGESE